MKRTVFVILLVATLIAGIGSIVWPVYIGVKAALDSTRAAGEYAGDHDCPPGQTPIEVVTRYRETFGGTTATGTRTAYFCEDAAGNRVNVTSQVATAEASNLGRNIVISVFVSIVAWTLFSVLLAVGAKRTMLGKLGRFAGRRTVSAGTLDIDASQAGVATLDPATREQVTGLLQSLGVQLQQGASAPAAPQGRTAAARLRELADLRKAGLITREEYEEQREAIVRSLGEV